MANFNVSYFVKIRNEFSAPAKRIADSSDLIKRKTEALKQSLPKTAAEFKTLSDSVKKAGKTMTDVGKNLAVKVSAPMALFGGVALKQSANLETLSVSFDTMLGSAEKSKAMMNDLLSFTATTPFQLEGVAQSAKSLLAFGVAQKDMIPTLRNLGDISAGAGVPLSDMAQIFGKAKSKGKLMTEEILQMAERGIPIVDTLAKGFGVTKAEIFTMASKSQISFDVMQQALKSMTAEGGIFFGQTEKQSQTLAGRFSTLKDNVLITSAALGDVLAESTGLNKILADMANALVPLAEKIKAFAKEYPTITKIIVAFGIFATVLAPVVIVVGQFALAIGSIIAIAPALMASFSAIGVAIAFLTGGFWAMASAVLAATWPFLAVLAAIWLVYKGASLLGDLFALAFPNAAAAMTEAIQNTFGTFFGFIDDAAQRFQDFISEIKNSGVAKIAAIFGIGTDAPAENAIQAMPALPSQNSQTDVNVNLRAPQGVIEQVKTKTTGSGANVGTNMVNG